MNVLRLLRTVRYLKPIQLYGRVVHHFHRPRPDLRAAPEHRSLFERLQPGAPRTPTMIGPGTFRFLNSVGTLATATDWDSPAKPRLWRYNLHYFDDLNADYCVDRRPWHRELVARWIRENPPGAGTGWEPYPVSLRIVNWIKWASADREQDPAFVHSLAVQSRWLAQRLEWHILGNHLWANGKALAFAGIFFVGAESDGWLKRGVQLLSEGLEEQVLPDGGHFERSPMYHAIVLEDVLDLLNLAAAAPDRIGRPFVSRLAETATRMLRWLAVMSHPDGKISFFNDAAFGVAPDLAGLTAYARRLGVPVDESPLRPIEALPASGYVRLTRGETSVICDVAPVGPDYLPGHAHADTLSFECSRGTRRVIVNSGTSTYDAGPERDRQRSTPVHNTVTVDGEDSTEVWAAFRVARRARPVGVTWSDEGSVLRLTGSHDGYRRLPGRVTHTRTWVLDETALTVTDRVDGRYRSANAHFHLAPEIRPQPLSPDSVRLDGAGGNVELRSNRPVTVSGSTWHPEFGVALPNARIVIPLHEGSLTIRLTWK